MTNMFSWMQELMGLFPKLAPVNFIEIGIIAILIYECLLWIMNSRAFLLLKGLGIIVVFAAVISILRLTTIMWLLQKIVPIAATALVIIFQPELRKALEQLGSRKMMSLVFPSSAESSTGNAFSEKTVNELVKASFELSRAKTGALMVIERGQSLSDIERTGIEVDGLISSQLLINIFEHNTPLHDGAVVIRGNRVTAATCYLPLSDNPRINKALGTRHRAAVGISEVSDSLTIVVSEETGHVTLAEGGKLRLVKTQEDLTEVLNTLTEKKQEPSGSMFKFWKDIRKDERKADK